jgi:hypothetical protein
MFNPLNILKPIISKATDLIPNPRARAKEKSEQINKIISTESDAQLAQLKINAIESQSKSLLASNWRPFLCFGLAYALIYMVVLKPHIEWLILVFNWNLPPLPALDMHLVEKYLIPLLGFGVGVRSVEKILKVASK